MFYILILQTIIYAINKVECSSKEKNNENINIRYKDDIITKAIITAENNETHNKIYQSIVQKFVEEHIGKLDPHFSSLLYLQYILPSNYEPDDIIKLCNEVEKTHINVSCDKFYHFYTKLFIESAQFSLGTIKTVFELHQRVNGSNKECRKALESNLTLFDDFIISINWLNSLLDSNHEICLLYNYHHFHTYYERRSNNIRFLYQYYFTSYITSNSVDMTNLVKYIQQYYKENNFTSNQKIIENENIQRISEWIDSNNDIQDKEWYETLLKVAISHINLHRAMQTKINYLSKPTYATNNVKIKQKYNLIDEQKKIIEKLQLDTIVKDIYNLKFNTMRMHTNETILEGIALITTFEENINQLIALKKHIKQFLLDNIKQKFKTAIQKSTEIPKNTKERCMIEIDKIASDMQSDTETSNTKIQVNLEETSNYDVFYDTLINSNSNIDLDPIQNDKLTIIIQTIKNEGKNVKIHALYSTLITNLNHIINMKHKLDIKSKENETTRQFIEDVIFFTKVAVPGTLMEKAAIQQKKNIKSCKDGFYCLLDEIIETKGMIVETEALVYKIIDEMRK